MPVYQYACTECGERLEVRQSFTDDALTVCPVCEGRLRKVLSAVGVVFKGSGFYRTDSREAAKGPSTSGSNAGSNGNSNGNGGAGEAAKPGTSDSGTGGGASPKESSGSSASSKAPAAT